MASQMMASKKYEIVLLICLITIMTCKYEFHKQVPTA